MPTEMRGVWSLSTGRAPYSKPILGEHGSLGSSYRKRILLGALSSQLGENRSFQGDVRKKEREGWFPNAGESSDIEILSGR